MNLRNALAIVAVLATFVSCEPKKADAATIPNAITVLSESTSTDSLKYLLRWTIAADAFGAVDGYVVGVTSTKGFTLNHTIAGTVDSFTVAKPAIGDSVSFTADVKATRRGITGPSATVSWKYIRKDQAPPAPGPIKVDSSQVLGVFVRPDVVNLAAGDSVHVCPFVVMGDSTIRIGIAPGQDSLEIIAYCSGTPLNQFRSERST